MTGPLDVDLSHCSIARTLELIGEKWTMLVLREAFNRVRRFDDMHRRIGAPRQVLSQRLGRLVSAGILTRVPYREPGQRTRYEYRLTDAGRDLYPVLVALNAWGSRYYADPQGSPLVFRHRDCGGEVRAELHCSEGHDVADLREVVSAPGPGARRREAS